MTTPDITDRAQVNRFADCGIEELVYQLVGAGSVCWENPGGAGVFDDAAARVVAADGIKRLNEILGGGGADTELLDALTAAQADNERLRAENARPRLSDAAMAAATQDDPTPCITCGHPRAEHGDGVVHTACCGVFPPAGSDLDEIECECDEFEADDEDGAR